MYDMSLSLRRRLLFLVPAITCALPQATSTRLPQSLQPLVPTCSWSCISSFIQSNIPTSVCPSPQDIDCLCSHAGVEGFNLEEAAFVCAHQNCAGESDTVINSTYTICSGRPNAHTVLPTTFTAKPGAMSATTTSTAASATNPSAMTASATPVSPPNHQLQTAQIVGISIAGAAVVLIAIVVAAVLVCLRRRRRHGQKLDSEPLPSEEFKAPSPTHYNVSDRSSPASTIKDPRRGAGGVGIAPAPVRYKAIFPPAQLFPVTYQHPPIDMGDGVVSNNDESRPQQLTVTSSHRNHRDDIAQSGHGPGTLQSARIPAQGVRQPIAASANAATAVPSVSTSAPSPTREQPIRRHPSLLLPARPDMAVLAQERPYSVTSQTTQFEEDFQSPTIPPKINNMTIYPIDSSCSSEQTTPSSNEDIAGNRSAAADRRKSRGPSLRINIPGKLLGPANALPPPPPRNVPQSRAPQRPRLATAGTTGLPYPPPPARTVRHQILPPPQAHSTASTASSSIPFQFPVPPSGRPLPVSEPTHTEQFRSDSIGRRGFSQPHTTAFQASHRQPAPVPRDRSSPLTVNGERINYPHIPRPSPSPANSYTLPSPPASFPLPPPPPRLPIATAESGLASNRSSQDTAFSNGSIVSASNSLLAKRRGSEQAAALEKQLYIKKSNFGAARQAAGNLPSGSPKQFRGAGHGRIDSKGIISPDVGTGSSLGSNPGSGSGPWKSHENNYVRGQPMGLQTRQGATGQSQSYGTTQWANPAYGSNAGVTGGMKQQYVPYYPPPPPRVVPRNGGAPTWSPSPSRITPTRRGEDLYLSVS